MSQLLSLSRTLFACARYTKGVNLKEDGMSTICFYLIPVPMIVFNVSRTGTEDVSLIGEVEGAGASALAVFG